MLPHPDITACSASRSGHVTSALSADVLPRAWHRPPAQVPPTCAALTTRWRSRGPHRRSILLFRSTKGRCGMTAMTPREQPKVTEPPRAEDQERPRGRYAVWGREIPFRNPNFTGREKELDELRSQLVEKTTAVIGQPGYRRTQ